MNYFLLNKFLVVIFFLAFYSACKPEQQSGKRSLSSYTRKKQETSGPESGNNNLQTNNPNSLDNPQESNPQHYDKRAGSIYERVNKPGDDTVTDDMGPAVVRSETYAEVGEKDKCVQLNREQNDPYRYDLCNQNIDFLSDTAKDTLKKIHEKLIKPKLQGECTCQKSLDIIKTLTTVDLSGSNISDLSPIVVLTDVLQLNLRNNDISKNASHLNSLTQLQALDLSNNKLNTLPNISDLDKLVELRTSQNNLSDINIVLSLEKIKRINIDDNPNISDIENIYRYFRGKGKNLTVKYNDPNMIIHIKRVPIGTYQSCPDGIDVKSLLCKAVTKSIFSDFL